MFLALVALTAVGLGLAGMASKKASDAEQALETSSEEEKRLIRIAQDHRARAARLDSELRACRLTLENPVMPPTFMANDPEIDFETGEDHNNL